MYRKVSRRPGCVLWVVFVFAAHVAVTFPAALIRPRLVGLWATTWTGVVTYLLLMVVVVALLGRGSRRLTERWIPICRHCGVNTDNTFRICRSCGRAKWRAAEAPPSPPT
jgi:cell division protein FtsW (lipid II flippase)